MVYNVHERSIRAPLDVAGALIDSLAGRNDRLWPRRDWPAMRLDAPLGVGAAGGHGPVRYVVTSYDPGRRVVFKFTGPSGFNGSHTFSAAAGAENTTVLKHELYMSPKGVARISWPVFFRPLHNSLIEESLDRAEIECSTPPVTPHRRSVWTRVLRAPFSAKPSRRQGAQ